MNGKQNTLITLITKSRLMFFGSAFDAINGFIIHQI